MEIFQVNSMKEARVIFDSEAPDLLIKKIDDEFRVWNGAIPKARQEPCAYYTNDLTDAVKTGIAMFKKGAW